LLKSKLFLLEAGNEERAFDYSFIGRGDKGEKKFFNQSTTNKAENM